MPCNSSLLEPDGYWHLKYPWYMVTVLLSSLHLPRLPFDCSVQNKATGLPQPHTSHCIDSLQRISTHDLFISSLIFWRLACLLFESRILFCARERRRGEEGHSEGCFCVELDPTVTFSLTTTCLRSSHGPGQAHYTTARIDVSALRAINAEVTQILIADTPTKLKHDEALDY
jgi:hypothetical protein